MNYENLYDAIESVTNDIHNFVGDKLLKLDNVERHCPICGSKHVEYVEQTDDYRCLECGEISDSPVDEKTRGLIERLEKLNSCASQLADVAHELEEHLAWDAVEFPD